MCPFSGGDHIYFQVGQILFRTTELGVMGLSIIFYGFDCLLHPLHIYGSLIGYRIGPRWEPIYKIVNCCQYEVWVGRPFRDLSLIHFPRLINNKEP